MGAAQPVCAALQSRSFLARTRLPPLHSSVEPCSPTEAEKSIVVLPGQPEASPASHPSCHEDHFQILTPSCCRWAPSVATTLLPCPCSSLPPAPATPCHMQPPSSRFCQGKTHRVVLQPHPCCCLPPDTSPQPPGSCILLARPLLLFPKPTLKPQPVPQHARISPSLVSSANVTGSSPSITVLLMETPKRSRPRTDPCARHWGTEQLQPFILYFLLHFSSLLQISLSCLNATGSQNRPGASQPWGFGACGARRGAHCI